MTELFEINGRNQKFIPTRDAARKVSYTPDYVTKLARDGKIISQKVGRSWYVDLDSLKLFVLERDAEKRRHQLEVRDARKREEIFNTFQKNKLSPEVSLRTANPKILFESLFIYSAIVAVFFLAQPFFQKQVAVDDVVGGLSAISADLQQAFLLEAFSAWRENLWLVKEEKKKVVEWIPSAPPVTSQVAKSSTGNSQSLVPQVGEDSGKVYVSGDGDDLSSAEVGERFSDLVSVSFYSSRHGTVTPRFDSGEIDEYPFVIVDEPISNSLSN